MSIPKVLMIGPGRNVMGGISTVVNNYYALGLDKAVNLRYLPTMEDGSKVKKLAVAMKAYVAFASMLKEYNIVHIHMAAQASFDRKSVFVEKAHRKGKKVIIHQHAADFDRYFFEKVDARKRTKIKKIFGYADKVIVLSEEWADFFGKNVCNPKKVEVLHNGVVMPKYATKDYSDHNVLMLGKLGKRKGTYDLLKAIPKVLETIPDAMFYLGGNGDIEQCKNIVAKANLKEHVKFLGWVRDTEKEEYLIKCSTFILPSYNEGMPMAVLEAMSYGLATVSTNAGGIPQIIEHGVSGIRVEAGNVDAIVETLVDVLKDKEKREWLGKAGRDRIKENFDFRKNVETLIQTYREMSA